MEAVKNLIANVPNWIERLDDLSEQIDRRQAELAELAVTHAMSSSPEGGRKSIRNRGSTESLRPRDDGDAPLRAPEPSSARQGAVSPTAAHPPLQRQDVAAAAQQQHQPGDPPPPSSPASGASSHTPSALLRKSQHVMAEVQAKARATVRKRQRTDSVISAEGAAPKYRTRSLIIVYYDSYVQTFFEELVKFVSASRNMMRKAKMAAKVAQIKRLAELEMPDEDDDESSDGAAQPPTAAQPPAPSSNPSGGTGNVISPPLVADTPLEASADGNDGEDEDMMPLRYVSTRHLRAGARGPDGGAAGAYGRSRALLGAARMGMGMAPAGYGGSTSSYAASRLAAMGEPPQQSAYDDLDKGLEYVQSMCEHAAHQFLRDGDCAEEIGNMQRRLGEVKEMADKELERVRREDPAALNADAAAAETTRTRSYRPHSMRRDLMQGSPSVGKEIELEVDEGISDMDIDTSRRVLKATGFMG